MTDQSTTNSPDTQPEAWALSTATALLWLGILVIPLIRWRSSGVAPLWFELLLPVSMLCSVWLTRPSAPQASGWKMHKAYRYLLLASGALMFAGRLENLLDP